MYKHKSACFHSPLVCMDKCVEPMFFVFEFQILLCSWFVEKKILIYIFQGFQLIFNNGLLLTFLLIFVDAIFNFEITIVCVGFLSFSFENWRLVICLWNLDRWLQFSCYNLCEFLIFFVLCFSTSSFSSSSNLLKVFVRKRKKWNFFNLTHLKANWIMT